jgi:hypothetical protein
MEPSMVNFMNSTRQVARPLSSGRSLEILGSPNAGFSEQKKNASRQTTATRPRLLATLLRALSAFAV